MSFRDIFGQERAVHMLRGAMRRGRLASTYLFAGEQGIGKRRVALELAKAVNCTGGAAEAWDCCGRCPSCVKIAAGTHSDVFVVEPDKGMIKIGQIRYTEGEGGKDKDGIPFRPVEEMLALKAHEARLKVVVVNDAERMNINAANAFLKTLEEPSAGAMIVLVSSAPDMLPQTIRSRAARVNFRPLPPEAAQAVIAARLKGKRAQDAPALAVLSMGRPGLAIGEDLIKARNSALADAARMLERETKPAWKDRAEIERWFDMAMVLLRDAVVLALAGGERNLVNADAAQEVRALLGGADAERILDCYQKLRYLRENLLFNLNKGITWNAAGCALAELREDG